MELRSVVLRGERLRGQRVRAERRCAGGRYPVAAAQENTCMRSSEFMVGMAGLLWMMTTGPVGAAPGRPVLDDAEQWRRFADDLGARVAGGETTAVDVLRGQLTTRKQAPIQLARPARRDLAPDAVYEQCVGSVVALGAVYKCNRCPHWHTGGTATGWVIGSRGEIASNYHVFADNRNTNVVAFGAMTLDGKCLPISEVLAADRVRDIAIVRVDSRDLRPLPVALSEPVGRPVSVIAHPSGDLFTFTQGHVSRYAKRSVDPGSPAVPWMFITADFAVGSSGGPVLNRQGAVVGMVARTATINADPKSEAPTTQMVVKMTIPAEAVLSLVTPGKGGGR